MRFSHLCCIVVLFHTIASQTCSNFEVGINRPGPWYAFVQTTASVEACCALCNAEGSRCQSWLFVRPGTSISPGCYLKQNIPLIEENSSCGQFCTGGVKSTSMVGSGRCVYPGGAFELAIDRPGSTYVRLPSVGNHSICCHLLSTGRRQMSLVDIHSPWSTGKRKWMCVEESSRGHQ